MTVTSSIILCWQSCLRLEGNHWSSTTLSLQTQCLVHQGFKSQKCRAGSFLKLKPKPQFSVKTEPKPKPRFWWKGKERKSIYIALFGQGGTLKALRHGSHSLPANNTMPAFPSWAFTRCHHHSNWGSGHPTAAHYSFIDPERMKGWVGLVVWPIADGLPI